MDWNRNLTNLRNTLAGLYWNAEDARRIALEAKLNPIYIRFDSRPVNTWTSIIEEAQNQGALHKLIENACMEYPGIPQLKLALRNSLTDVESGEIETKEWRGPESAQTLEKITGAASTLRPINFLEVGLQVSRSVCRIVMQDGSKGTGFLSKQNLLLTCHHVIGNQEEARGARAEFNFQKTIENRDAEIATFELAPEEGFFTSSSERDNGDDWTAVRLRGNPNANWGELPLHRVATKVLEEVFIIQHPGGGDKQIALSHNIVVFANEKRLQYLTDTLAGSSGSPVFNVDWQVVGIHHKGGWIREPGSKQIYFRNQAILINVVLDSLVQNPTLVSPV
jgi:V8-like Glu-specific endopeptidase